MTYYVKIFKNDDGWWKLELLSQFKRKWHLFEVWRKQTITNPGAITIMKCAWFYWCVCHFFARFQRGRVAENLTITVYFQNGGCSIWFFTYRQNDWSHQSVDPCKKKYSIKCPTFLVLVIFCRLPSKPANKEARDGWLDVVNLGAYFLTIHGTTIYNN